jgi:ubiquinone/menaquinone biosynthesis C-methylase UbiE
MGQMMMEPEREYKYEFDVEVAHEVGVLDGALLSSGQVATQNNRGYQMQGINPLFQSWIQQDRHQQQQQHQQQQNKNEMLLPIMDIGCAFGSHTFNALYNCKVPHVIAVDMTRKHLDYISNVHKKHPIGKLDVIENSLPLLKGIPSESVSSILCAEVIHFLTGDELPIAFKRMYDILAKNGHLQLTCLSVYCYQEHAPELFEYYFEHKRKNPENKWPGFLIGDEFKMLQAKTLKRTMNDKSGEAINDDVLTNSAPPFIHVFTPVQVASLADDAGFVVESIRLGRHEGYPELVQGARSNLQMIATKL